LFARVMQMTTFTKKSFSMVLTAIALLLLSHSIGFARFEIGYFGMIHGLPVSFFLALAVLTTASGVLWSSKQDHGRLLGVQMVILVCALWLVPQITGGSPPFDDHAYRNLRLIDQIVREGHFSAQEFGYLSWPGSFILMASLSEVFGVDPETMLHIFPVLMQLLMLLPLYTFLRNTLGESRSNYCWVGIWLFYLASWTGRQYLGSAPGIALFLLLTFLALVTTPVLWEKSRRRLPWLGLTVVVFIGLAITHLLTSLAALCILGALTLIKKSKVMIPVTTLCLVLVVSWNLTGMERQTILGAFSSDVITPSEGMEVSDTQSIHLPGETLGIPDKAPIVTGRTLVFSPDVFIKSQITGHITGSGSHSAVNQTRLWFSAFFVVIGLTGAIRAVFTRRDRSITFLVLALTLAPLVLAIIPYGGRSIEHLYVFSLAPMAYFGARLIVSRKQVVALAFCLLLVVALPFHLISHYGNQAYDYFPQSLVRGMDFSYDNTPATPGMTPTYPWATLEPVKGPFVRLSLLEWQDHVVIPSGGFKDDSPRWLYLHRQHHAYYGYLLGEPSFLRAVEAALGDTTNCQLTYSNPDFKLYRLEPVAPQ
jgi:hypothetical protein